MEQIKIKENKIIEPREILNIEDLDALVNYFRLLLEIEASQKEKSNEPTHNGSTSSTN